MLSKGFTMLKESYQHIRRQLAATGAFQVNNLYGTLSVLVEAACLTVGFIALFQVPHFSWMYWALQIFLGSSILRCMAIQHECTHKTLFRQKFWNTFMGCLISPLSLHPYLPWRELHHQHHQWTGIADRDPAEAHLLKLRGAVNLHHLYL